MEGDGGRDLNRSVFKIRLNTCDGAFCKNSLRLLAVNCFPKKALVGGVLYIYNGALRKTGYGKGSLFLYD